MAKNGIRLAARVSNDDDGGWQISMKINSIAAGMT